MSSSLYTSRKTELYKQPQDIMRHKSEITYIGEPVRLKNFLPFYIDVIHERPYPHFIKKLGSLPPNQIMEIPYGEVNGKDLFHFQYQNKTICSSIEYRTHHGIIGVGGVSFSNGGYKRDYHPNGDISSVRLWNMLPFSLYVYHNGRKIGWMHANENVDHQKEHGNVLAAPSIYFDNGNMGLKLGDTFELKTRSGMYIYDFALNDRNISEIMIGKGTVENDDKTKPETHIYRLGHDAKDDIDGKLRGDYFPRVHNAPGTDMIRSSAKRSRVPVARHLPLSKISPKVIKF